MILNVILASKITRKDLRTQLRSISNWETCSLVIPFDCALIRFVLQNHHKLLTETHGQYCNIYKQHEKFSCVDELTISGNLNLVYRFNWVSCSSLVGEGLIFLGISNFLDDAMFLIEAVFIWWMWKMRIMMYPKFNPKRINPSPRSTSPRRTLPGTLRNLRWSRHCGRDQAGHWDH